MTPLILNLETRKTLFSQLHALAALTTVRPGLKTAGPNRRLDVALN
jgi:hypothetical protein